MGQCVACGEWNTLEEEVIQKPSGNQHQYTAASVKIKPKKISEIKEDPSRRISMHYEEFNRVLGGGIVPGSLVLVGGEPGIGKSTLLLQAALHFKNGQVLYITGEESEQQIKMRAERLGIKGTDMYVLTETVTQRIFQHVDQIKPDLLIVDSIQTLQTEILESAAGSISQVRESTAELQRFAKLTGVPVILIGHITKEGTLAGPKLLEHIVDTVLQFEGDRNYGYRILRAIKNRFGSTAELGIFEMVSNGLREISNPSEILLSGREEALSGVAVAAMIEGLRPMMIETQALVSSAAYGTPQRSSTGYDIRRLNMLLAVLEKRSGFRLGAKDVFLNIAGGLKVDDPAIDLSIISAILSSNENISIDSKICFAGEVGLSGEIRSVSRIDQRIAEADKLGFEKIFISKYNRKEINQASYGIEVVQVARVEDVFRLLFG